jgi:hypothetical protein
MKLWHDDIRRPPDESWTVARTNAEALTLLAENDVTEASFDYQLAPGEDGLELAKAMAVRELVPPRVNCHSWSPGGASAMAEVFRDAGAARVTVQECDWT